MPLTLTVSTPGDPPAERDYTFDAERVTIGRGAESTLVLPDTKRVVSKEHAAVVRDGDGYALLDLGSKNCTYLHGEALEPERPYPLQDGDAFTIGEFTLRVAVRVALVGGPDQTVFGGDFLNPFLDDAAVLAATLRSMAKTYDAEPTARRDDALLEAVRTAAEQAEAFGSPVLRLFGSAFGAASGAPPPVLAAAASAPPASAPAGATERALEAMGRALARILSIPQRFRHEFIGQTIVQGPDASPLYSGDAEALRQYLLQAGLDAEEGARRARHLQEAADTLALHHVALLEGYRASVREGSARLLEAVDPTAEPPEPPGFLAKVFPVLRRVRAADEAARRWHGLREEDWAVAERRVFRPAFIKAYLQRAEPDERRGGDTGSGSGVRRALGRSSSRS